MTSNNIDLINSVWPTRNAIWLQKYPLPHMAHLVMTEVFIKGRAHCYCGAEACQGHGESRLLLVAVLLAVANPVSRLGGEHRANTLASTISPTLARSAGDREGVVS